MPKTRSRSRTPHRGPRHDADPDRRVKYSLRFRRRGGDVEPEMTLVRRGRRTDGKDIAPRQAKTEARAARRRDRHQASAALGEVTKQLNAADGIVDDTTPSDVSEPDFVRPAICA